MIAINPSEKNIQTLQINYSLSLRNNQNCEKFHFNSKIFQKN